MIKRHFLEFERSLEDISEKIDALEIVSMDNPELRSQINKLESEFEEKTKKIYSNLTRWNKVQISRHPQRPHTSDYILNIFTDFDELHGDRQFGDDPSIIGGLAKLDDIPVMIIGHEKGKGTDEKVKRNFGMPQPEGYRKAKRLMKLAEQFEIPIITFVDTSGAYPGVEGEERGQSEAIANNLLEMSDLSVPILSYVIGEGGSGGALAIGVCDHLSMLEYSVYSVISPEGCASILWKSPENAHLAAEAMCITAENLQKLKLIDELIPEPLGGAHRNISQISKAISSSISKNLDIYHRIDKDVLIRNRKDKLSSVGFFQD